MFEEVAQKARKLREDISGSLDVRFWILTIVLIVILVLIVAALMPTLNDALADYNASEPTFGGVLQDIVPLLIGVGILLAVVFAALRFAGMRK